MGGKVTRDLVLAVVIGAGYYFLYTNLVGIAAAIAFPEWFVPFARENKALSLVLFSLVTTLPAAAAAAAAAGYSITRLVSGHRIWWGVAIVLGCTLYYALSSEVNEPFIPSPTSYFFPSSMIYVPGMVAWWTFLPLSVALFVWRSTAKGK